MWLEHQKVDRNKQAVEKQLRQGIQHINYTSQQWWSAKKDI